MRMHRVAPAAVALAALGAVLAGCSGTAPPAPSASGSPVASADARNAKDELAAAAGRLRSATYKFQVKVGDTTMQGAANPAIKGAQLASKASAGGAVLDLELIVVGTDFYARVDGLSMLGIDRNTWLHVDGTKIKSLALLGIADPGDPTGAGSLSKQLVTVTVTGRRYQGTLDLTKASVAGLPVSAITALGDAATSVPFEATVDAQGRLTALSFTVPAQSGTPATPIAITYSDFGSPVGIAKPTTTVAEAPAAVYSFLGG